MALFVCPEKTVYFGLQHQSPVARTVRSLLSFKRECSPVKRDTTFPSGLYLGDPTSLRCSARSEVRVLTWLVTKALACRGISGLQRRLRDLHGPWSSLW